MTISEIAKLAGVSSSAVSRFLNGGSLSEEKRIRIGKVVEEQNYVPSTFARSLRTKKSNQIGVIVPKIDSEAVPRIISGISEVLNRKGYQFFLANTNNDYMEELKYIDAFQKTHFDGIILLATVITKAHREMIEKSKIPIVVVGEDVPKCSCVFHDDKHAAYDLTTMLIRNGCRRFGYLSVTEKDKAVGLARTKGFLGALEDNGFTEEDYVRQETGFSMEEGKEAMARLLDRAPDVDGVFCATDNIAIGAMMELKQRKIAIPDQVKICGIGDNRVSNIIEPKLTTIHFYYDNSGHEAANMLLNMIQKKEDERSPVKRVMLSYELVRKETL